MTRNTVRTPQTPSARNPVWRRLSRRTRAAAGVALTALLLTAGCAFDPATVPVPGAGVDGPTYRIHIEFANALNLPAKARVVANGAEVGSVAKVSVVDAKRTGGSGGYVSVDADIQQGVRLPVSTVAELRQDTVLGDIHIALMTPPGGFGSTLTADSTIPLQQTKAPLQIEDAMAGMATFVQGGAIGQFQDIINQLNAVLPADPAETARISAVLGANAVDLAQHMQQVDVFLNSLVATSSALHEQPNLSDMLTADAVAHTSAAVASIVDVVGVLGGLGGVAHSLVWLAPLANSGDAAAKAFVPLAFTARPLDLNAPSNLKALVELIRDKIIPFVERGPKVNLTRVTLSGNDTDVVSTDDQVDSIVATLRMIGAVR